MNNTYSHLLQRSTINKSHPDRKVKVVSTIGPACETEEQLAAMMKAGMDIARFNTKHNKPDWHLERILRVKKVAKKLGYDVGVLLDLQGPEVRVTLLHEDSFPVKKGDHVIFTSDKENPLPKTVFVPENVITSLKPGNEISVADGSCEFKVVSKEGTSMMAEALDDFEMHTRKTLNTPGVVLDMPSLLEADIAFLEALKDADVEFVGLSFVRDTKDIQLLQSELKKRNMKSDIIAKIENQKAIDNLDSIIEASDAVMVARGDLGVELPFYEVPHWQKVIIEKCRAANKPVITATQMLLSMVKAVRPTRAEVSDVANAVYDGTDAVMCSEETTIGRDPVHVVTTQAKIVQYHEKFISME